MIVLYPYRGSTTNEKIKFVSEYEDRKIETLIVQDGTNKVHKHHHRSLQEHFAENAKLVKKVSNQVPTRSICCMRSSPCKKLTAKYGQKQLH